MDMCWSRGSWVPRFMTALDTAHHAHLFFSPGTPPGSPVWDAFERRSPYKPSLAVPQLREELVVPPCLLSRAGVWTPSPHVSRGLDLADCPASCFQGIHSRHGSFDDSVPFSSVEVGQVLSSILLLLKDWRRIGRLPSPWHVLSAESGGHQVVVFVLVPGSRFGSAAHEFGFNSENPSA